MGSRSPPAPSEDAPEDEQTTTQSSKEKQGSGGDSACCGKAPSGSGRLHHMRRSFSGGGGRRSLPSRHGRTSSSMLPFFSDVISISFFMAVFFPVFIVLLAFACLRLFRPLDDDDGEPALADTSSSEWSRRGGGGGNRAGLDAAEIAALPLVSYRDARRHRIGDARGDPLECAVCLLEFEDDDALRLLPACPHAFHPECIGLWLEKHVTCPLCRANVLDAPPPPPPPPPSLEQDTASPPPAHETVVVIGDAGASEEAEAEERIRIQCLAGVRRAAGRQALPRSNSTGHERGGGGMERFALRLPEHVRLEILMSHRLRHVTSAVASVRVREGSAHDAGAVRNAVARLLSLFVPGAGWKGDDEGKSSKAAEGSSRRRRDESARGGVGEEKRSE
uniref:RING-type E3 ubiquitin transferase n=1 Tax=Oryza rufipogon TaxID=4529 RepID=A0A0E0NGQ1_ORYRU